MGSYKVVTKCCAFLIGMCEEKKLYKKSLLIINRPLLIGYKRGVENDQIVSTYSAIPFPSRLHGGRGKVMAGSFSREKLRHASQKEGG